MIERLYPLKVQENHKKKKKKIEYTEHEMSIILFCFSFPSVLPFYPF